MSLVGLPTALIGAAIADLKGSEVTRPFTRTAFWLVALGELGLSITGLASFLYDVADVLAGAV